MERNHIPFTAREVLVVDAGTIAKLSVVQSAIASRAADSKIEYQNIQFYPRSASKVYPDGLYARYGFEERGYLLEEPLPLMNLMNNYAFFGFGTGWRFPKPYKLLPGQQMRADYDITAGQGVLGYASVVFPCKRADNGEPYILHGTNLDVNKLIGAFTGDTMAAPADTPLLVEGVQIANAGSAIMGIQLYDGNGGEIIKVKPNNATLFTKQLLYSNIWWRTRKIELGAFNGWELPAEHPLILEVVNDSSDDFEVLVTVQGSAEVGA